MLPHFHLEKMFFSPRGENGLANNIWGIYFKSHLKIIAEIASNARWPEVAAEGMRCGMRKGLRTGAAAK